MRNLQKENLTDSVETSGIFDNVSPKATVLRLIRAKSFKSEVSLWLAAICALSVVYFIQFQWVRSDGVLASLRSTAVNIIPLIPLGVIVRIVTRRLLFGRFVLLQLVVHTALAVVFSQIWYLLILVAGSFQLNWLSSGFNISPFYASATTWQLLQGVILYAALQGIIYGRWLQERAEQLEAELRDVRRSLPKEPKTHEERPRAIFIKHDREFLSIDPGDVIHIQANGDYVSLHTRQGVYSSGKSLNDFADELEDIGFIRAHRSHLVNLKSVQSAEPTGDGRLSLHLSNGTTVIASRNGSRTFRRQAS